MKIQNILENILGRDLDILLEAYFNPENPKHASKYDWVSDPEHEGIIFPKNYSKDVGNVIYIDQSKLDIPFECNFDSVNPQIQKFASQNPDHLAFVLGIPLASQGLPWDEFQQVYPAYMALIALTDGNPPYVTKMLSSDNKELDVTKFLYRGKNNLIDLWKHRAIYHEHIYGKGIIDDPFQLYMYLSKNVTGLGTAKAGFGAQLLKGVYGCMDSINTRIYGVPAKLVDIRAKDGGMGIKSIFGGSNRGVGVGNRPYEKPQAEFNVTKGQLETAERYIKFLNTIGKRIFSLAQNSTKDVAIASKIWDHWTIVTGIKAFYRSNSDVAIVYKLKDGTERILKPYGTRSATLDRQKEVQSKHDEEENPFDASGTSRSHLDVAIDSARLRKTGVKDRFS